MVEVEHDYNIVLVTGERIDSQSDTFFYFVDEKGQHTPAAIVHFFHVVQMSLFYTHVYVTEEFAELTTAKELIPISAIAKYIKK